MFCINVITCDLYLNCCPFICHTWIWMCKWAIRCSSTCVSSNRCSETELTFRWLHSVNNWCFSLLSQTMQCLQTCSELSFISNHFSLHWMHSFCCSWARFWWKSLIYPQYSSEIARSCKDSKAALIIWLLKSVDWLLNEVWTDSELFWTDVCNRLSVYNRLSQMWCAILQHFWHIIGALAGLFCCNDQNWLNNCDQWHWEQSCSDCSDCSDCSNCSAHSESVRVRILSQFCAHCWVCAFFFFISATWHICLSCSAFTSRWLKWMFRLNSLSSSLTQMHFTEGECDSSQTVVQTHQCEPF